MSRKVFSNLGLIFFQSSSLVGFEIPFKVVDCLMWSVRRIPWTLSFQISSTVSSYSHCLLYLMLNLLLPKAYGHLPSLFIMKCIGGRFRITSIEYVSRDWAMSRQTCLWSLFRFLCAIICYIFFKPNRNCLGYDGPNDHRIYIDRVVFGSIHRFYLLCSE